MCVGLPMQVISHPTSPPGDGRAWVVSPGESVQQARQVETALLGTCVQGEWLLVFLGSARERISAERAAEIHAVLTLVAQAGSQDQPMADEPLFALPSAMDPQLLRSWAG